MNRRTLLHSAATATAASLLPKALDAMPAAGATDPSCAVRVQHVLSLPEFEERAATAPLWMDRDTRIHIPSRIHYELRSSSGD